MKNKTLIIGCGRLGSTIANYSSDAGDDVTVIDPDSFSFDRLSDVFSGFRICADATDIDELEDAGIKDAAEVIITTGSDSANLFLAHVCAEIYEVPNVYVRFDDPDYGFLIQGLPIKAIYPFQLSVQAFNRFRDSEKKKKVGA